MYLVIGAFDCGCDYEAGFGSLEVVVCATEKRAEAVLELMNEHSANYQCEARGALHRIVINGKLVSTYDIMASHPTNIIQDRNLFSYVAYLIQWHKQDRELEKWKKKFAKKRFFKNERQK